MFLVKFTSAYRKAYKKLVKSGNFPVKELDFVIDNISKNNILDLKHRDHRLKGDFLCLSECHNRIRFIFSL